jgi:hypothetical protein
MKKAGIAVLLCVVAFSCKKENLPTENLPAGFLSRVLISGEPYQEFTYTSSGLIDEEKSWGMYTKYVYNSSSQLVKLDFYVDPSLYSSSTYVIVEAQKRKEWASPQNVPKSTTNTYTYSKDGQYVEVNLDRANGNKGYSKYNLNSSGQISKLIFYSENQQTGYIDYFYNTNNNLIRRKHYYTSTDGKSELSDETEYEFDNKKNPFSPFRKLLNLGRETNQNNITKETYTLYGELPMGTERIQTTVNNYEYNELSYPVEVNGETVYEYK